VKQLAFGTYPFPKGFKKYLLRQSDRRTARIDEIARLNFIMAQLFADAAKKIARKSGISMSKIDLIGSHGQTIHHLPGVRKMFGKVVRATLQIGDPSVIAKLTGVVTVGNFRSGDIAVGGTGAPLVPYVDYLLFRSNDRTRALLNIGGIANVTVLPKGCGVDDVCAFDTGPGNMLIDGLMERFFGKPFDHDGEIASRGNILPSLLLPLMHHPFLAQRPPKSTGREEFGEKLIHRILRKSKRQRKEDVIATVTEYTALCVYHSYLKYVRRKKRIDELIVSGGGVHNAYLMNALKDYFKGVTVRPMGDLGYSSDAKEAVCFALLANETLHGNPSNVPGATGAKSRTALGTICLP